MDKLTCKVEDIIDVEMLPYGYSDAMTPEIADEARIPEFETSITTPVACHFFFPMKYDGEENRDGEQGQDPLALQTQSANSSEYHTEHITVDDELIVLENGPTDSSSFSIIDPLQFVESDKVPVKMEPTNELVDIKPSTSQLKELTRKRKSSFEPEPPHEFIPPKYVKLENGVPCSKILLKNAVVNIGPKLPLPQCFRRKNIVSSQHDVVKSSSQLKEGCGLIPQGLSQLKKECDLSYQRPGQLKEEWDLTFQDSSQLKKERDFTEDGLNIVDDQTNNSIILKIYTCSKCNHKCTDPSIHEIHIAACVTKANCNTETSGKCIRGKRLGYFKCETCSYKFKHENNLILHMSKHSTESFCCYICEMGLPTIKKLCVHFSDTHLNLTRVLSCNICKYSSLNINHIRDHLVTHNSDIDIYCRKCRRNYEDSVDFNNHLSVHIKTAAKKKRRKGINSVKTKPLKKIKKITEYFRHTGEMLPADTKQTRGKILPGHTGEMLPADTKQMRGKILPKHTGEMLPIDTKQTRGKILPAKVKNSTEKCELKSEKVISLESQFRSETIQKGELYLCNGCSYKFMTLENLNKHKEHHLNAPKPHRCSVCSYESLSLVNMSDHAKTHSNPGKAECNVCSEKMSMWSSIRSHAVKHVYDGLYCPTCRMNLEDTETFWEHMSTEHQRGKKATWYSCSKCSFTHSVPHVFKRHMRIHMANEVQSCFKELQTNSDEKNGVRNKVDIEMQDDSTSVCAAPLLTSSGLNTRRVSKCEICKLKFVSTKAFEKHQKTHDLHSSLEPNEDKEDDLQNWTFKCSKCSYETSKITDFVKHVTFSHALKNEPFKCSFCANKYVKINRYIGHLKSHSAFPSYSCRFCNFKTKNEARFEIHMKNHRSICCPICVFKTQRMRLFKLHMTKQHKPGRGSFSCSLCPYGSFSQNLLSIHSLKCHPKEFASLKIPLPNHLLNTERNQSTKSHMCSYCSFTSSKYYDLKRHLAAHFVNGSLELVLNRGGRPFGIKEEKKIKLSKKKVPGKPAHLSKKKVSVVDKTKSDPPKESIDISLEMPKSVDERSGNKNHSLYKCSQCDFINKDRRCVVLHLLNIHNIVGSVRNHMIAKVSTTPHVSEEKIIIKSKEVERTRKKETGGGKAQKNTMETCTRCDVDKFSEYAQSDHKRCGHDAFWMKPYSCSKCGVRFINKQSCERHKTKHIGENLKCRVCNNFKTHRIDTLKVHYKKCLEKYNFLEVQNGSELCKVASQHTEEDLAVEVEDEVIYSDDENFTCGECDFVTMDVVLLTQHMFIHSGIPDD